MLLSLYPTCRSKTPFPQLALVQFYEKQYVFCYTATLASSASLRTWLVTIQSCPTRYFHIHKERIPRRSPLKTWQIALARISLAIRRSGSVENKLDKMTWNIFGLICVTSIRQTTPNSRTLSTPCFVGTATRLDTTSISQMFQTLRSTITRS
jgi:hypothetical protein